MAKRLTRNRRQKSHRHRRRSMKGGSFSQQELQQLQHTGFTPNQIQMLTDLGVSINEIMQKVNTIRNNPSFSGNQDDITEQVMVELLNEHIFDNQNAQQLDAIPHADDDVHNLDMDQSFESQGSLHLSDLDTSNTSGYTTNPDESFGGLKRRRKSKKRLNKKGRKTRRRKQRGGMCFGNGVGANSNDPNYSIYNTNMLKLFPYKPN
jgi:hypothetical protein